MGDSRKQHWEQLYADKSPDEVSWYQPLPQLSLDLISRADLPPRARIIDVGGGASRLVDHLLDAGYRPAVLDISAAALAHARRRLGERADAVDWFESDVTAFDLPQAFDLWHDRAVFHFLTEAADRAAYVTALGRALKPGGQVIIAAFAIGGPTRCSGLEIVQYDADRLMAELGDGFGLIEQVSELHLTPGGGEQQFGYYRFVRR